MVTKPTYGLIGRGRVASHMARYLELEAQPFLAWHRGMPGPPERTLDRCDVLLLAISDDAIGSFVEAHPRLTRRPTVHFSGSLVVEGLLGCHPLMTFGPELYDLEIYRSIPFITERGGPGFHELFPHLANPTWTLDTELKPLYHAMCVLGGNFTTLLWSKVLHEFEARLALPREALRPYLEQTCRNAAAAGGAALTGPLARRDHGTVERDLEALAGDPYAGVYRAFAAAFDLREADAAREVTA
jgi:predicted short-subunit dehydrogenase-like oxidoreductase (DUF2520 family)